MTCKDTWPTWKKSTEDGCERILIAHQFYDDVAFGKTKVFIRTPQTLFKLEELRRDKLPDIALIIQRVCKEGLIQPNLESRLTLSFLNKILR